MDDEISHYNRKKDVFMNKCSTILINLCLLSLQDKRAFHINLLLSFTSRGVALCLKMVSF